MLFNFQTFVNELRENPAKKEVLQKYEKYYGAIEGGIYDQLWYKEFISKFNTIKYIVPEELNNDFDWKLLMQLIGGSFSSEGSLQEVKKGEFEFVISVKNGDQPVIKKMSELWGFQILRLYEIYVEEQMNLHTLIAEDEEEKAAISARRKILLPKWNSVITSVQKNSIIDQSKEGLDEIFNGLI